MILDGQAGIASTPAQAVGRDRSNSDYAGQPELEAILPHLGQEITSGLLSSKQQLNDLTLALRYLVQQPAPRREVLHRQADLAGSTAKEITEFEASSYPEMRPQASTGKGRDEVANDTGHQRRLNIDDMDENRRNPRGEGVGPG